MVLRQVGVDDARRRRRSASSARWLLGRAPSSLLFELKGYDPLVIGLAVVVLDARRARRRLHSRASRVARRSDAGATVRESVQVPLEGPQILRRHWGVLLQPDRGMEGPVRIAQEASGYDDEIGLAAAHDLVCLLRRGDQPDRAVGMPASRRTRSANGTW